MQKSVFVEFAIIGNIMKVSYPIKDSIKITFIYNTDLKELVDEKADIASNSI